MGSLGCDAYRQEGFKAIAGLARSRTMRTPVNAYHVNNPQVLGRGLESPRYVEQMQQFASVSGLVLSNANTLHSA